MTKKKRAVVDAFEKGYRVIDGRVYYKGKERKLYTQYKKSGDNLPYYSFGVYSDKSRVEIYVHQLAAYQKYGKYFIQNYDLVVNHKDHNSLNNREDNIFLVPPSERSKIKKNDSAVFN